MKDRTNDEWLRCLRGPDRDLALDYNLVGIDKLEDGSFEEDDETDIHYCSICLERLIHNYNKIEKKLSDDTPEPPDGISDDDLEEGGDY